MALSYDDFAREEDERIEAHFDWVLLLLRAQPLDGWSELRKAARARTLKLLEEYARRGKFPRNRMRRDRMVPAFIDELGTTCAVAQLMIETGASDLAGRIHRTMNFAYVAEMTSDELLASVERAGLTPSEAALIQPDYCSNTNHDACHRLGSYYPPPCDCPTSRWRMVRNAHGMRIILHAPPRCVTRGPV